MNIHMMTMIGGMLLAVIGNAQAAPTGAVQRVPATPAEGIRRDDAAAQRAHGREVKAAEATDAA